MASRLPEPARFGGAGSMALERQPRARPLVDEEEQAGLRRNGHLGVIPGGFQFAIAVKQGGVQFVGAFHRGTQHRRSHAVHIAAASVEHQQPLRGKDLRIELGKGLGKGAARLIGCGQCLHSAGRTKQFPRLVHQRRNRVVKHDAAHGSRRHGSPFEDQLVQLAAPWKDNMIDFGKVVIFAGQPEDGRVRTARGGSLPRARQRGGCFERRIQRPAEKSNLLAGHHRSGALPESCKRRSGGLRWRWILLRKEPHQLRPVRGNSRARLPTHAGRKRSEKWPHSRVSGAEVLKYPAEARRNGNGMTVYSLQLAHLGLMDCINWRNPPWLNLNSALLRMPRQAESMHKGPGQSHLDPRMGTQGHGLSRLWRNPMF